jgi:hypothetical protein
MTRDREGTRSSRTLPRWRGVGASLALWLAASGVFAQSSPLYTSSPRFRIPFQFDPQEMARIGAAEVQLHVSTNGGGNWTTVETVAPDSAKFTFDAPGNGQYWFAVRTIDRQGKAHPQGGLQPSLHVVVDDQKPTLSLGVAAAGAGQAEAVWQADDDHLDLSSLTLEYLDPLSGVWQPLPTTPAAVGSARFNGPSRGPIMVRGSIRDLAGNTVNAEASGTAVSAPQTQEVSHPGRPDWREPVAESPGPADGSSLFTATSRSGTSLPTILPNMAHAPVPSFATASSPLERPGSEMMSAMPPGAAMVPPNAAAGVPVSPGVENNAFVGSALPQTMKRVNARTFRIGYEVHDVGPSGVGSVELYISEDNGGKWFHYGADPDRQSPFEVVVPRDGQYSFAIRVRNGLGVVADPPQPGTAGEIGVIVDQTPPSIRLMPLQQESAGGAYQIRISWFVQDDRLADRPISLSQGASATGPWEPITGWIENNGRYLWSVSALAPKSIYVRIEARDAAGNVATTITEQPLLIDTSRPTARILDVESVGAPTAVQ